MVTRSPLDRHQSPNSPLPCTSEMQHGSNLTAFLLLPYTHFTRSRTLRHCISVSPCDMPPSTQLSTLQTFLSLTDQPLQLGCMAITGSWWDCSWPSSPTKGITTGGFFLLWRLYQWPGKCHFFSKGQFSENEKSCYTQLKHMGNASQPSPIHQQLQPWWHRKGAFINAENMRGTLVGGWVNREWWLQHTVKAAPLQRFANGSHKQDTFRVDLIMPCTRMVLPHPGTAPTRCSPLGWFQYSLSQICNQQN